MDYIQKDNFSEIMLTAIEAALKAGEILKSGYRSKFRIDRNPGKHNLVTEYDLLSEKAIIAFIKERFKDHKILCEEEGVLDNTSDIEWIIDPLDGTVNFAHEIPMFSVSIAVRKNLDIICGVVYHPLLNELFYAEKNKGAFLNGSKISVSKTKDINDAILSTGFPYDLNTNPNSCKERFANVLKLGIPIRRIGSAAIDLAYVAAGRFDGFWEMNLGPWDIAAGMLLIKEAGGKITTIDGLDYKIAKKNTLVATNNKIHEQFIDLLKI